MQIHKSKEAKADKEEKFIPAEWIQKPIEKKFKNMNQLIRHIGIMFLIVVILCLLARYAVHYAASNHKYQISGLDYLYGSFRVSPEIDHESFVYKNIRKGDRNIEVTELPTTISAINRNNVIVGYSDKMKRTYLYKARAVLVLNKLVLLPWCFTRDIVLDTHKRFTVFDVDYSDGDLVVSRKRENITLNSKSKTYNYVHIEGSVCSEKDYYNEIQSLNIKYDPYYDLLYECEIIFTDGSIAKDVSVESADIDGNKIVLSWSILISECNGDKYEHYSEGTVTVNYVDTYPMGFIILDSDKAYRYQEPFEAN